MQTDAELKDQFNLPANGVECHHVPERQAPFRPRRSSRQCSNAQVPGQSSEGTLGGDRRLRTRASQRATVRGVLHCLSPEPCRNHSVVVPVPQPTSRTSDPELSRSTFNSNSSCSMSGAALAPQEARLFRGRFSRHGARSRLATPDEVQPLPRLLHLADEGPDDLHAADRFACLEMLCDLHQLG